jgi:hypothetical protein
LLLAFAFYFKGLKENLSGGGVTPFKIKSFRQVQQLLYYPFEDGYGANTFRAFNPTQAEETYSGATRH